jgi:hypothetical protein
MDLFDSYTGRDYTSEVTVILSVFSVTLLGNGYQRQMFVFFRADVLAGWRPSHLSAVAHPLTNWPRLAPTLNRTTGQSQRHVATDGQSVSKSWFQGSCGSHDRIFISVHIYEYCFIDFTEKTQNQIDGWVVESSMP